MVTIRSEWLIKGLKILGHDFFQKSKFKQLAFWGVIGFLFLLSCRTQPAPQFKVLTTGDQDAITRVYFEDLPQTKGKKMPLEKMGLFLGETQIPIWLGDSSKTHFEAGDWFEFVAHRLPGERAYYHEFFGKNAYRLRFDVEDPVRAKPVPSQTAKGTGASETFLMGHHHIEQDKLLMRFPSYDFKPYEIWYWRKLSCTDKQPFEYSLQLPDLHPEATHIQVTLNLRGWSRIWGKGLDHIPDHELKVRVNGQPFEPFHWNERAPHNLALEIPVIAGQQSFDLAMSIPRRNLPNGDLAIDVVLLNWIEVSYRKTNELKANQDRFVAKTPESPLLFQNQANTNVVLWADSGQRIEMTPSEATQQLSIAHNSNPPLIHTSSLKEILRPKRVVPWLSGDLRNTHQQADYLMITHPKLTKAIQPLANYHRQQGLSVKVVDVRHVYDSFNHGIVHPRAIKNFIRHAYHQWESPAPKFVLLVGDASWDSKNLKVRDRNYSDSATHRPNLTAWSKIASTAYDSDNDVNDRNLIPTTNFFDETGHSASDNYFVTVDGDDMYPDLAIGRFPVTKPAEVEAIVSKTIAFDKQPPVGPWRQKILMITNDEFQYQRRTDLLASEHIPKELIVEKIYPASREKSNEFHTQNIVKAMDQGQSLIYFYGHGGRFIWRTGPPDIRKNHDLFTLKNMDQLAPNTRLPVVLSFTCYSAPFDHPSADSIGEKFLRLDNRGAVAFVGASWRNFPKFTLTKAFLKTFSKQRRVGEALMLGKRELVNKTLVQTYNLLGDPAVSMMRTPEPMSLSLTSQTASHWIFEIGSQTKLSGKGELMVKAKDGTVILSHPFDVQASQQKVTVAKSEHPEEQLYGFQVYVWDTDKGKDWFAILEKEAISGTVTASQP